MTHNLYSHFRAGFADRSAQDFLIEPGRAAMTYGDLDAATARIASIFRSLGVEKGDRIALWAEKSSDGVLVYLAALRAGAVFVPFNPAYTLAEVESLLALSQPRILICGAQNAQALGAVAGGQGVSHVLSLTGGSDSLSERAADASAQFEDAACAPDDLAAILFTSGTTGMPKGVMLSHDNLRSNAQTLREEWRFTADDRLLHALPLFHTHGLFVAVNVTLASGGAMIFLPKFDAAALVRNLPDATVLMGVPTFYVRLLEQDGFTADLTRHMRLFISGSAPLSAETHRQFEARTGHAILERYGMTETNMNTSNPYDGNRVPGSVGFPLPGVEVRIAAPVEKDGRAIGSIEVRGPNVFQGYWQMPERTAEEFTADGFFITGDLGYFDAQGYLHIAGREKDLIISGGFNVYPAEVERAIEALPGVAECAVIGLPDSDLGEVAVAVIVREPGSEADEGAIMRGAAHSLARYKQPRRVHFVDQLPRNAMGKVQKTVLRQDFSPTAQIA